MNEMINTRLYADSESSTLYWMTFNLEIVISKFYLDTCFQNSSCSSMRIKRIRRDKKNYRIGAKLSGA